MKKMAIPNRSSANGRKEIRPRYYDNRLLWLVLVLCILMICIKLLCCIGFGFPFEVRYHDDYGYGFQIRVSNIQYSHVRIKHFHGYLTIWEMLTSVIACTIVMSKDDDESGKYYKQKTSAYETLWLMFLGSFPLVLNLVTLRVWIPCLACLLLFSYLVGQKVGFELPLWKPQVEQYLNSLPNKERDLFQNDVYRYLYAGTYKFLGVIFLVLTFILLILLISALFFT